MSLLLGLVIVIISLYFVAMPLLEDELAIENISNNENSNETKKEYYLQTLEDIETDYKMNKITEEGFLEAQEEVRKEAGKVLD